MSEIATAYVQIIPSMQGAQAHITNGLKGINMSGAGSTIGSGLVNSIGSKIKGLATVTAGVATAAGTALGVKIAGGLDAGIKRFDTMNNFPKVMKNFGVGADEAQAAIKRMSDSLKGLPTPLDSAVSGVQRLVSKNSDINKSTDLFLAMNNAIMAGGGSVEMQASAIEQLTQAYARGKMDMMEWRNLSVAMPAQLNQVAKSMGISTDKLGEGLRSGKISMDDFMATIDKLNKEGGEGFDSFAEQARAATGGLQTQIANVNTAISRGWAKILSAFGQERFSKIFSNMGSTIDKLFEAFVPIVEKVGLAFDKVVSIIEGANGQITPLLGVLGGAFLALGSGGLAAFIAQIPVLGGLLAPLGGLFAALGSPIGILAAAFVGLVATCEPLRNTIFELGGQIKTFVQLLTDGIGDGFSVLGSAADSLIQILGGVLTGAIGKLVQFISQHRIEFFEFARAINQSVKGAVENVIPKIQEFANFISQNLPNAINAAKPYIEVIKGVVENVANAFVAAIPKILEFVGSIRDNLMNVIKACADYFNEHKDRIAEFAQVLGGTLKAAVDAVGPILGTLFEHMKNIAEVIVQTLLPHIGTLAEVIGNILFGALQMVSPLIEGIKTVVELLAPIIAAVMTTLMDLISPLLDAIMPLIDAVFNLFQALSPVLAVVGAVVGILAGGIIVVALGIISGAINALIGVISGIVGVVTGVIDVVSGFVNVIVGLLTGDLDRARQGVSQMWEGVKQIFSGAVGIIKSVLLGFVEGALNFFTRLATGGKQKFTDLLNQAKNIFNTLKSAIGNTVSQFVSNFISKVGQMASQAVQKFNEFRTNALNVLRNAVNNFISAGYNLMAGIAQGVQRGVQNVLNKIRNMCQNAWECVKGFFGINSPSRLMAFAGSSIGEGFAKGVVESTSLAVDSVKDMSDAMYDAALTELPTIKAPSLNTAVSDRIDEGANSPQKLTIQIDQFINNDTEKDIDSLFDLINQKLARNEVVYA